MPTDFGCAPGICQGQPALDADNCAEVNGCDEKPGYDQYADSRAIVAKARIEMQAENEATADRVMAWLDDAEPEVRRKFFVQYVENRRSDYAANDYAETRLSEMREAIIKFDAVVTSYMLGDIGGGELARAQHAAREVARG